MQLCLWPFWRGPRGSEAPKLRNNRTLSYLFFFFFLEKKKRQLVNEAEVHITIDRLDGEKILYQAPVWRVGLGIPPQMQPQS